MFQYSWTVEVEANNGISNFLFVAYFYSTFELEKEKSRYK